MTEHSHIVASIASWIIHECMWGEHETFCDATKRAAQYLVNYGYAHIYIQCLANGNLEFPDEVMAEAKLHHSLMRTET